LMSLNLDEHENSYSILLRMIQGIAFTEPKQPQDAAPVMDL